jgi:hypothetical protein
LGSSGSDGISAARLGGIRIGIGGSLEAESEAEEPDEVEVLGNTTGVVNGGS